MGAFRRWISWESAARLLLAVLQQAPQRNALQRTSAQGFNARKAEQSTAARAGGCSLLLGSVQASADTADLACCGLHFARRDPSVLALA